MAQHHAEHGQRELLRVVFGQPLRPLPQKSPLEPLVLLEQHLVELAVLVALVLRAVEQLPSCEQRLACHLDRARQHRVRCFDCSELFFDGQDVHGVYM